LVDVLVGLFSTGAAHEKHLNSLIHVSHNKLIGRIINLIFHILDHNIFYNCDYILFQQSI